MLNSYYSSNVMIREFEPEVTQVKLEMGAQNSIVGENKTTLPPPTQQTKKYTTAMVTLSV